MKSPFTNFGQTQGGLFGSVTQQPQTTGFGAQGAFGQQ
jgi:hypothetical protein